MQIKPSNQFYNTIYSCIISIYVLINTYITCVMHTYIRGFNETYAVFSAFVYIW